MALAIGKTDKTPVPTVKHIEELLRVIERSPGQVAQSLKGFELFRRRRVFKDFVEIAKPVAMQGKGCKHDAANFGGATDVADVEVNLVEQNRTVLAFDQQANAMAILAAGDGASPASEEQHLLDFGQ